MPPPIRIGALISGGGTNLQAIIDACEAGKIDGEVVFIGSDNPDARGLERAETHRIPSFVVDYTASVREYKRDPHAQTLPADFDPAEIRQKQSLFAAPADAERVTAFLATRAIAEAALLAQMAPIPFDLLVLAGFMRNLTPYFIDRVNTDPPRPKIMNIHPALLPAFPGVDGYGDTFRYGGKIGGCTVHFIDYGEDSGPIIGQRSFAIEAGDTLETVKKKGLALEWELYPDCIRLFAEKRLKTRRTAFDRCGQIVERTIVEIVS